MKLYGKEWTRRDLEARLGRLNQIGGLHRLQNVEGPEAGVEEIQVRTGAGLSYSILPTRGLDIGLAEFRGAPFSWLSPNGAVHPAFFDSRGTGWLRTAVGGLLMTCGLSYVGSPDASNDPDKGLHGRAHHTPARQVCAEGHWEGDEYMMEVQGKIEETSIFGSNLCLTRHIRSTLGENNISIQDTVENAGFKPATHMHLYHFNFGFPLLEPDSEIHLPAGRVTPREPDIPVDGLESWQAPQAGYRERVYYHENLPVSEDGMTSASIRNPHFPATGKPLSVQLAWDTSTLPILVQWKMPGEGIYALGLEPANCHVEGRAAEEKRGSLVSLAPGQTMQYHLEISIREE